MRESIAVRAFWNANGTACLAERRRLQGYEMPVTQHSTLGTVQFIAAAFIAHGSRPSCKDSLLEIKSGTQCSCDVPWLGTMLTSAHGWAQMCHQFDTNSRSTVGLEEQAQKRAHCVLVCLMIAQG